MRQKRRNMPQRTASDVNERLVFITSAEINTQKTRTTFRTAINILQGNVATRLRGGGYNITLK